MKEKLDNFWYYYKKHVIIGVILGVALLFPIVQCATETKTDFDILCIYTGFNDFSGFEKKAADIVGDINGDGKLLVTCDNLSLTGDEFSQNDIVIKQKLPLSIAAGEHLMYIMDKEFFESEAYGSTFKDLRPLLPEESLEGGIVFEGNITAIPAENCPFLKDDENIDCTNLYVGIPLDTAALQKQKNSDALFEASERLMRELAKPAN